MRKNIEKVIEAFNAGKAMRGDSCSTTGNEIYSYNMLIARRNIAAQMVPGITF